MQIRTELSKQTKEEAAQNPPPEYKFPRRFNMTKEIVETALRKLGRSATDDVHGMWARVVECIEAPEPEELGIKIECSATQKSFYVKATVLGFPGKLAAYRRILELSDGSLKDDHGHALKMPILLRPLSPPMMTPLLTLMAPLMAPLKTPIPPQPPSPRAA